MSFFDSLWKSSGSGIGEIAAKTGFSLLGRGHARREHMRYGNMDLRLEKQRLAELFPGATVQELLGVSGNSFSDAPGGNLFGNAADQANIAQNAMAMEQMKMQKSIADNKNETDLKIAEKVSGDKGKDRKVKERELALQWSQFDEQKRMNEIKNALDQAGLERENQKHDLHMILNDPKFVLTLKAMSMGPLNMIVSGIYAALKRNGIDIFSENPEDNYLTNPDNFITRANEAVQRSGKKIRMSIDDIMSAYTKRMQKELDMIRGDVKSVKEVIGRPRGADTTPVTEGTLR